MKNYSDQLVTTRRCQSVQSMTVSGTCTQLSSDSCTVLPWSLLCEGIICSSHYCEEVRLGGRAVAELNFHMGLQGSPPVIMPQARYRKSRREQRNDSAL